MWTNRYRVVAFAMLLVASAALADTAQAPDAVKPIGEGIAAAAMLLPPPWNAIAGILALIGTHVVLDKRARRATVCPHCKKSAALPV